MDIGRILILCGALLVAIGLIVKYAPWLIDWFGKLPGDIHIRNENSSVFFPVASMIVISLILSIVLNLWLRK